MESVIKQESSLMRVIKLKEHWDSKDSLLVINDRITEMGMIAYWKAIDASFKFNSNRHEIYAAKAILSSAHAGKDEENQSSRKGRESPDRNGSDLMKDFFHRHRNEGREMTVREDQCRVQNTSFRRLEAWENWREPRQYNRFMLPRPRFYIIFNIQIILLSPVITNIFHCIHFVFRFYYSAIYILNMFNKLSICILHIFLFMLGSCSRCSLKLILVPVNSVHFVDKGCA